MLVTKGMKGIRGKVFSKGECLDDKNRKKYGKKKFNSQKHNKNFLKKVEPEFQGSGKILQ